MDGELYDGVIATINEEIGKIRDATLRGQQERGHRVGLMKEGRDSFPVAANGYRRGLFGAPKVWYRSTRSTEQSTGRTGKRPTGRTKVKKAVDKLQVVRILSDPTLSKAEAARRIGMSLHTLINDEKEILTVLAEKAEQESANMRSLQLIRLEGMLETIQSRIDAGDLPAIDRGLQISDRIRKLYNLDVPITVDWRVGVREQGIDPDGVVEFLKGEIRRNRPTLIGSGTGASEEGNTEGGYPSAGSGEYRTVEAAEIIGQRPDD